MKNETQSGPWRTIGYLVLIAASVFLISKLRTVVYPLLFGLIIAVAALPLVQRFEQRRFGRTVATTFSFLIIFGLLSGMFFFVGKQVGSLGHDFFAVDEQGNKTGYAYKAFDQLEILYNRLDERYELGDQGRKWIGELPQKISESWKEIAKTAGSVFQFALAFAGSFFTFLSLLFLTPLFAFLILLEFESLRDGLLKFWPKERRAHLSDLFDKVERTLGKFLRGRLLTGFLKGTGQAILLVIGGAPYPVLTGVLSLFCSFIPVIGPALAFAPALILCAVQGYWGTFVFVLVLLALGEVIENYLLVPRFIGSAVGLGTIETILALMIGGALLGFVGLFLAIPLAAILKILVMDYIERRDKKVAG